MKCQLCEERKADCRLQTDGRVLRVCQQCGFALIEAKLYLTLAS